MGVDVAKYRMAVLRERMDLNEDPDDGQSSDLTSEWTSRTGARFGIGIKFKFGGRIGI
jgi:hypothetical protein